MPRTTLNIDASILRELKERQRKERKPLGQIVSELLARSLAEPPPEEPPFEWHSQPMHALVDLEDKEAVYPVLDAEMGFPHAQKPS